MPELGDNLIPKYSFEWDNGTERSTDDIQFRDENGNVHEGLPNFINAVDFHEWLAEMGEEDENCDVSLTGYET